ncbi:BldC family transcriptional regulator [Aeromicrobium sp. CTD01-1L150]|uniref:BldC family transcriptional regulator n=1 Tax=Aeromicrobium sp. CTD01-1L150 TaxID=3341830 RepID=UPI0035BF0254
MADQPESSDAESEFLTPAEVARLFAVDPGTVSRWANSGKLPFVRTLGGHRRFPARAIAALLDQGSEQ